MFFIYDRIRYCKMVLVGGCWGGGCLGLGLIGDLLRGEIVIAISFISVFCLGRLRVRVRGCFRCRGG